MKRRVVVDIEAIEKNYVITDEGMVFSKVRNRWLKPHQNHCGYIHYCLTTGLDRAVWYFAHTLVAYKYIGRPENDQMEIDHIDNNRTNNDYRNLRWVTHSENILKAYRETRTGWWLGKHKKPFTLETKMKMANAKKKAVIYSRDGVETRYESIEDAAKGLGTYRKMIYLCVKEGKTLAGGSLSYAMEYVYE